MKFVFALSLLCTAQMKVSAGSLEFRQHIYPSDWENRNDTLEFGTSAAVEGDWMFIGAEEYGQYWKDSETEEPGTGAVYVFRRLVNQRWGYHQILEGYGKNSEFGTSVAISGKHAIIGAHQETVTGYFKDGTPVDIEEQGAAYLFELDTDNKWKRKQRVLGNVSPKSSAKFEVDEFGKSVAIDGEYAVVGAPEDEPEYRSEDGALFVYRRDPSTGNWSEDAHLYLKDTEELGYSVDISGDTVIGGASKIKVKSPDMTDTTEYDNFGSVYVWKRNSTRKWNYEQTLVCEVEEMQEDAYFGANVAISGDNILIGGRKYDSGEGAVCFFQRVNGKWTQKQLITIPDIVNRTSPDYEPSNFGVSVRLSGSTALIGAKYRGAFLYMIENNSLVYKKAFRCNNFNSPCDPTDDYFGLKTALGNNGEDAVVTNYHDKFGKPLYNGIGIEIGSANVFTSRPFDTTSAGSTSKSVSSMSQIKTTTQGIKTTTQGRQTEAIMISSALVSATLAPALILLSAVL